MSKIFEFFSKLNNMASKIMAAMKDIIENSLSAVFYICMLYFVILAIYFSIKYFIKLIYIIKDLLFDKLTGKNVSPFNEFNNSFILFFFYIN